ncbi:hypothetical protein DFR29_102112 [Tahibacter aquaticus]|jgi:hypothetical protein|uniref:Uncharacterized protein n=1 Tax=Tahibacter aquaticus TaxID=520092 RepID=A0A4R6Z6R5_9GAMM|nr:hypothetical protein [Tahibacter aquaticus]TDR47453.1 hypothetical protein DFR29_102112 [Tahibacter aquaticus]
MLNLIITPWFRILDAERDGAAEPRQSFAHAAEPRRGRAQTPALPGARSECEIPRAERAFLAAVPRAC